MAWHACGSYRLRIEASIARGLGPLFDHGCSFGLPNPLTSGRMPAIQS
jgi:hypothetical protein